VVYHGLGLRGRIEHDSAQAISKKINRLIADYPEYKQSVLKMKEKFDRKKTYIDIVNVINGVMNDKKNC
jgi:uncharacterized coiled-coil DUF342 family protein